MTMMDCCARCGTPMDDLRELTRYADDGLLVEIVCSGCCVKVESVLSDRIQDDPELMAFVLAMSDAIDRLHLRHTQTTQTV